MIKNSILDIRRIIPTWLTEEDVDVDAGVGVGVGVGTKVVKTAVTPPPEVGVEELPEWVTRLLQVDRLLT